MSSSTDFTKYGDPSLTKSDIAAFEKKKKDYFKGTIAVSVIYGVLVLLFFVVAIISQRGRDIITGDILPFTITFVIGVSIIVISLVIFVTTAKPVHVPVTIYDSFKCPDYWTLSPSDKTVLDQVRNIDPKLAYAYSYKCTPPKDQNLNNPTAPTMTIPAENDTSAAMSQNMRSALSGMQGDIKGTGRNLKCNVNYPQYLYLQDVGYKFGNDDSTTNNFVRCQVAKSCGYSWTSACPNMPTNDL